MFTCNVVCRNC